MDVEAGNLSSANYGHGGSNNVYWATLEFSSMKEMNNGCSLGELFTIDVLNPPENESSRASIGTAFNINYETEDIINDILETNDIPYTKTNTTNKYYDSINLTGLDSYTACSFTASFKNRKMVINGSDIKLVNNTENIDYTNIVLDEDSDNSLIDISRDISLYDFYNTVTVYGDNVKYTCRDYKSVKKVGAIELEETDLSIVSEDGAKTRARKLLDLHSKTSNAISFKTSYDNIPYLKPGQIIQLDYSSENIPKGHYIVLSIDYHLGEMIKVMVGHYNKNLTNRVAELVVENKKINANLRSDRYEAVVRPALMYETIDLNPTQLMAKYTTQTITSENNFLGFDQLLGFDTNLGFVGTTISTIEYRKDLR
jgi:hypothetical protein